MKKIIFSAVILLLTTTAIAQNNDTITVVVDTVYNEVVYDRVYHKANTRWGNYRMRTDSKHVLYAERFTGWFVQPFAGYVLDHGIVGGLEWGAEFNYFQLSNKIYHGQRKVNDLDFTGTGSELRAGITVLKYWPKKYPNCDGEMERFRGYSPIQLTVGGIAGYEWFHYISDEPAYFVKSNSFKFGGYAEFGVKLFNLKHKKAGAMSRVYLNVGYDAYFTSPNPTEKFTDTFKQEVSLKIAIKGL